VATISTRADVFYPESDAAPMGETTNHRDANTGRILSLQDWFADDPPTYVSVDEFLDDVEGQPRFVVSPDVRVVRGIDKTVHRQVSKTWLEGGQGPDLVVELTSKSTRREDQGKNLRIDRDDLKVREDFLFDPSTGRRLRDRLERREADAKLKRPRKQLRKNEAAIQEINAALDESQREVERLRGELDALRAASTTQPPPQPKPKPKPKPKRK